MNSKATSVTRIQLIDNRNGYNFLLNEGSTVIGREADSDIQLDNSSISRQHCRIDCSSGSIIVRDLGSTNGTYINGEATSRVLCDVGDELRIGDFRFRIEVATEDQVVAMAAALELDEDDDEAADLMAGLDLDQLESIDGSETNSPDLLSGLGLEQLDSVVEPAPADEDDVLAEFGLEGLETAVPESRTTPGRPKRLKRENGSQVRRRPEQTGLALRPPTDEKDVEPVPPEPASKEAAPTPAAPATQPKPGIKKPKRTKEPRDWSQVKKFLEERTFMALTLIACVLLAAIFIVPWASFFRTSDSQLVAFYESALQQIEENRGADGTTWREFSERLGNENWAYVTELSSASGLSLTAKQLLRAGRDDLPKILKESRTQKSSIEELFANRVKAARDALEGKESVATNAGMTEAEALEDPEDSMFGTD